MWGAPHILAVCSDRCDRAGIGRRAPWAAWDLKEQAEARQYEVWYPLGACDAKSHTKLRLKFVFQRAVWRYDVRWVGNQ